LSHAEGALFAKPFAATDCVVCGMTGNKSLTSSLKGHTYYFCSPEHKVLFDKSPQAILDLMSNA